MKQVFTTVVFLLFIQYGWSQIEMKLNPRLPIQDTDSIVVGRNGVQIWKKPFHNLNAAVVNPDSSRFSHLVPDGSIFTSLQDNMPWLKPNPTVVYNMPVRNASGNENMPNAYQQPKERLLQSLRKQIPKK